MKSNSYRNHDAPYVPGTNSGESRSPRERAISAVNARPTPRAPYRRYPSLSDDGQPYFPRLRLTRRRIEANATAGQPDHDDRFFSVRVVALLLLVGLIAVLAAKN